jgi:AraC family transcriptional regulator
VRVGLVYLRPRQVAFVRAYGPYKASADQAWSKMTGWLARHGLSDTSDFGYGLLLDNPTEVSPDSCRYDACVQVPDQLENLKSDGLAFQKLPGGPFARVRYVGPMNGVREQFVAIRDQWLPRQLRLGVDNHRPFMVIYVQDPARGDRSRIRCDVCVPVRIRADEGVGSNVMADAQAA